MESQRCIVLFTEAYPYQAVTEEVFVEPDVAALAEAFDRVVVVPLVVAGELRAPQGMANVEVDTALALNPVQHSRWRKALLSFHPFVVRYSLRALREMRSPRQWLKAHFYCINCVTIGRIASQLLRRHGLTPDNALLYTFWFLNATSALARLARRQGWRVVARAHNHDVFEGSHRDVAISPSLRRYTLRHVAAVYPVSADAEAYLRSRYPAYADKIQLRLIGSVRLYDKPAEEEEPGARPFTVLSVARTVPVKRVERNLQVMRQLALSNPDKGFRWIHVGDGSALAALRAEAREAAPPNLDVDFRGAMPNALVQRLYATEPVDLFMLLSQIEGLPIAVCEALSYGVPVVATDVGGNREVVGHPTGILVDADATAADIASQIAPLLDDPERLRAMRRAATALWQQRLDARALRARFAAELADKGKFL